ncbi:MAG: hypothetical protein F2787_06735 [Actinobacteria bacterium]|uniref:Unannotated protein n=1 Tax=freshwater metagenome TaxID=449393 RepID=A0A6J6M2D1_9ZZZZ|nr:hypothetical protein [Actinomycetota bacterium]MSX25439.1 hypothetical protein [Actinomycetota bacterium]MSY46736.1 hypothetical protein [Actinomycetota bacterium]MTB00250.1 hypothetical protein [Actinomycetota bacterium]
MLVQRVALILRIAALTFFLVGVLLIVRVDVITTAFGFSSKSLTSELRWTLHLLGAILLIPALLAPLVAAFAGERGLRQAAAGMAFLSLALGAFLLLAPGGYGVGKFAVAGIAFAFSGAYFFALKGRRRNR